jgi:formate/nitrite transporter FocA (FNT family)
MNILRADHQTASIVESAMTTDRRRTENRYSWSFFMAGLMMGVAIVGMVVVNTLIIDLISASIAGK